MPQPVSLSFRNASMEGEAPFPPPCGEEGALKTSISRFVSFASIPRAWRHLMVAFWSDFGSMPRRDATHQYDAVPGSRLRRGGVSSCTVEARLSPGAACFMARPAPLSCILPRSQDATPDRHRSNPRGLPWNVFCTGRDEPAISTVAQPVTNGSTNISLGYSM